MKPYFKKEKMQKKNKYFIKCRVCRVPAVFPRTRPPAKSVVTLLRASLLFRIVLRGCRIVCDCVQFCEIVRRIFFIFRVIICPFRRPAEKDGVWSVRLLVVCGFSKELGFVFGTARDFVLWRWSSGAECRM